MIKASSCRRAGVNTRLSEKPLSMANEPAPKPYGREVGLRSALVGGALLLSIAAAHADYKLDAGDSLNFTVAGLPELSSKTSIDVDGDATLPLVGSLHVAGLSVPQVLAKVQAVLPSKEFRRHAEDGREFPIIISPSDIGLAVAEYRPIYLSGDVAKPGEEPFRPSLTVRKAIALAGGFDILRYKLDNPFLQLSDLTSEYNTLWIEYAREQSTLARLKAELGNKSQIDPTFPVNAPIATSLSKDLLTNDASQLAVRNADFAKEKSYLKEASDKEIERAKLLSDEQGKEQEGLKNDTADLQRYSDLYNKGAVALPGLSEARRTVLQASTRVLQTTALLDSVEREQQDLARKLDRTGDVRQMLLLQETQNATVGLAATRSKLQAVSDKLRYTGMIKSQLVRGVESKPKITIIRSVDSRQSVINGDVDTELQPGDTIDVALQSDDPIAVSE